MSATELEPLSEHLATVGLAGATLVHEFEIAHVGWECDTHGWVVDNNGKRHLILTNHGTAYLAEARELTDQLGVYARLAAETRKALEALK